MVRDPDRVRDTAEGVAEGIFRGGCGCAALLVFGPALVLVGLAPALWLVESGAWLVLALFGGLVWLLARPWREGG